MPRCRKKCALHKRNIKIFDNSLTIPKRYRSGLATYFLNDIDCVHCLN